MAAAKRTRPSPTLVSVGGWAMGVGGTSADHRVVCFLWQMTWQTLHTQTFCSGTEKPSSFWDYGITTQKVEAAQKQLLCQGPQLRLESDNQWSWCASRINDKQRTTGCISVGKRLDRIATVNSIPILNSMSILMFKSKYSTLMNDVFCLEFFDIILCNFYCIFCLTNCEINCFTNVFTG